MQVAVLGADVAASPGPHEADSRDREQQFHKAWDRVDPLRNRVRENLENHPETKRREPENRESPPHDPRLPND